MADTDNINIGHVDGEDNAFTGKTEWEDALIKHGVIQGPAPTGPTDDEIDLMIKDKKESEDPLESKSLDELAELEDDGMDEDVVKVYREKRLAEIRAQKALEKFGSYAQIGQTEFVKEVTEASKNCSVVCHLFVYSKPDCQQMNSILESLSKRHKECKFVKIISSEAIPNYPDASTPTLLLYKNGNLLHQIVGTATFGGLKMSTDTVEWILGETGLLKTDQEENPFKKIGGADRTNLRVNRKGAKGAKRKDDDDDDDDEDN